MTGAKAAAPKPADGFDLTVRRLVPAPPAKVFEAWTRPQSLKTWWGPAGVTCIDAEIDLRPGGRYTIGNQLPDGHILWICGRFLEIDAPHRLAYSWATSAEKSDGSGEPDEYVAIRFDRHPDGTEVVISHRRIADRKSRDQHEIGWRGCLEGLDRFLR